MAGEWRTGRADNAELLRQRRGGSRRGGGGSRMGNVLQPFAGVGGGARGQTFKAVVESGGSGREATSSCRSRWVAAMRRQLALSRARRRDAPELLLLDRLQRGGAWMARAISPDLSRKDRTAVGDIEEAGFEVGALVKAPVHGRRRPTRELAREGPRN